MVFSWPHLTQHHFCHLPLVMAVMKFCPGSRGGRTNPTTWQEECHHTARTCGMGYVVSTIFGNCGLHNHTASKMGRVSIWTQLSLHANPVLINNDSMLPRESQNASSSESGIQSTTHQEDINLQGVPKREAKMLRCPETATWFNKDLRRFSLKKIKLKSDMIAFSNPLKMNMQKKEDIVSCLPSEGGDKEAESSSVQTTERWLWKLTGLVSNPGLPAGCTS